MFHVSLYGHVTVHRRWQRSTPGAVPAMFPTGGGVCFPMKFLPDCRRLASSSGPWETQSPLHPVNLFNRKFTLA